VGQKDGLHSGSLLWDITGANMMRWTSGVLVALLLLVGISVVNGQDAQPDTDLVTVKIPTDDQEASVASFEVVLSPSAPKPGDEVTIAIRASVKDGWHIYPLELPEGVVGLATEIEIDTSRLEPVGDGFESSSKVKQYHWGEWSWSRKFTVSQRGVRRIKGSVKFQACNDKSCLPPKKLDFVLKGLRAKEPAVTSVTPEHKSIGEPIVIALSKYEGKRPKAKLSVGSLLLGSRTESLALRGTFRHEDKDTSIYLKKSRQYTLANTGPDNSRFSNDSSYFSIDHDGDGEISENESFASNRPFRVGDEMFQVTGVDKENLKLTIQKIAAPLSGTIVGRKCPPFEFTTVDGKKITDQSILGKVTFLDVWAVT